MPPSDPVARAARLNAWSRMRSARAVLTHALTAPDRGRLALVSSFGAESVVLLHMVSAVRRDTPVIFLDTELLFAETMLYQQDLAQRFGLRDLRIIRPPADTRRAQDPDNMLHRRDPDACCALRKTVPLQRALAGFDGWITGRKRYQGGARAQLDVFEPEPGTTRMKINPLAQWTREDARSYMDEHDLPRHPLLARGYASIGCQPCTSPITKREDARDGRWRGREKTECGIHVRDGHLIKAGEDA